MLAADELIVDSFAGGGGASLGIRWATGRCPDVAINHDAKAIAMHEANHPETLHLHEDVWKASPRSVTKGKPVGLLWASPDCKHFSRAKGSKPVNKTIRSLAWVVVKWAAEVKPRVIILENVREFAEWGPLVPRWTCGGCEWRGTEGQANLARGRRHCPRCHSRKLVETSDKIPDPKRKGLTFKRFVGRLRNLGYAIEYRNLDAADYGAPTHRRRLFLIARRDGLPIEWPEATHCHPSKAGERDLFSPPMKPWRTAAECIDWDIPCKSIFDRAKPLAEATMKRIAHGVKRYVIDSAKPFIVRFNGAKTENDQRGQPLDRPTSTLDTSNRLALVTPFFAGAGGSEYAAKPVPAEQPFGVIKADDHRVVVAPTLIQTGFGERDGQAPRVPGLDKPLGTVVAGGGKSAIVAAMLKHFGGVVGMPIDQPTGTVTATDHHSLLTAHIQRDFGASVGHAADDPLGATTAGGGGKSALVAAHITKFRQNSIGSDCRAPLDTITSGAGAARPAGAAHAMGVVAANLVHLNHGEKTESGLDEPSRTVTAGGNHAGLVAANLVRMSHGEKQCNDVEEPLATVTTQHNKAALVYSFLVKYFGTAIGQVVDSPLHTVTGKDRFGVVTVTIDGQPYVIVDIGMRMLTPRELARAQGFPDDYKLSGNKSNDVARIGNSVCPIMSKVLVEANLVNVPAVHV